jgi:hypothetical protein
VAFAVQMLIDASEDRSPMLFARIGINRAVDHSRKKSWREPAFISRHLQIFRRFLALVRDYVIRDLVAFAEVIQTSLLDSRDMDEYVLAATAVGLNEAIAFCC